MPPNFNNRFGQRFTGTLFGKKSIREALVEMLNCFYSPKISVKTRASDGTSTIISPCKITMGPTGWVAEIDMTSGSISFGGGYVEEYDDTHAYTAGNMFKISAARVVAGITLVPGLYAVPVAGTDRRGLKWAGYVPANPTGNQVPQYVYGNPNFLPTLGASPNDQYYAECVVAYCGGM